MIDSHSHIYMPGFDEDRAAVIERAAVAGITQLLQVGCNLEESRTVVALAESVPGIYASVGVHPHEASSLDAGVLAELAVLTAHPMVVAWGEIGLDYYYDSSPREQQREAFRLQLEQAVLLKLPVVIHTRDAEADSLEILSEFTPERGGQVHCFTGTAGMAGALVEMGYHIGFTGIITFKRSEDLRDVVRRTPLERILIETDSPYLAPVPKRGKRNEPAFVGHVAACVAEIKDCSLEQVLAQTDENFKRLYGAPGMDWETLGA